MKYFNIFCVFILLSGCWGGQSKKATLSQGEIRLESTFKVSDMNHISSASEVSPSETFNVPSSRIYEFKAKILNQVGNTAVSGHQFKIHLENKDFFTETTNGLGELRWKERLSFDYFSYQPKYISLERVIEGTGLHKGRQNIRCLVDPWVTYRKGSNSEVICVTHPSHNVQISNKYIAQTKTEKTLSLFGGRQNAAPLVVKKASIRVSKKKVLSDKATLNLQMSMSLSAQLKTIYGQEVYTAIHNGDIKAYVFFVNFNMGIDDEQHVSLLSNVKPQRVRFHKQGEAFINIKGYLKHQTYHGDIGLAIKLQPEKTSLRPYEAFYSLGKYKNITSRPSITLVKDKDFRYDEFTKHAVKKSKMVDQNYLVKYKPFSVPQFAVHQGGVLVGETATQRSVMFRTELCFLDSMTGERIINQRFFITFEDKPVQGGAHKGVRYTNQSGCIPLTGHVTHKYYKPERQIRKIFSVYHDPNRIFTDKNFNSLKDKTEFYKEDFEIALNPWAEGYGLFGLDARYLTHQFRSRLAMKKLPSKFFISAYHYNTLGFKYKTNYRTNVNLDMEVRKRIQLVVYPFVLRHNSVVLGRDGQRPLRDGIYLMKVGLQKTLLSSGSPGTSLHTSKSLKKNKSNASRHQVCFSDKSYEDIAASAPGGGECDEKYSAKELNFNSKKTRARLIKNNVLTEHISVYQKLVRSQNGVIIEPVAFGVREVKLMKLRANMIIQLETVNEKLLQVISAYDKMVSIEVNDILKNLLIQRGQLSRIQVFKVLGIQSEKALDKNYLNLSFSEIQQIVGSLESQNLVNEDFSQYVYSRSLDREALIEELINGEENIKTYNWALKNDQKVLDIFSRFNIDKEDLLKILTKKHLSNPTSLEMLRSLMRKEQGIQTAMEEHQIKQMMSFSQNNWKKNLTEYIDDKQKKFSQLMKFLKIESDKVDIQNINKSEDEKGFSYLYNISERDFLQLTSLFDEFYMNGEEVMRTILRNDFSDINTNVTFDLNWAIEQDSGLKKRSFIGPLTLIAYDNSNYLRPTDRLRENSCSTKGDCLVDEEEPILTFKKYLNEALTDSPNLQVEDAHGFYEDERAMSNISVDDLIYRKRTQDYQSKRNSLKISTMDYFTKLHDLSYVSDYPMQSMNEECLYNTQDLESCVTWKKNHDSFKSFTQKLFLKEDTLITRFKNRFKNNIPLLLTNFNISEQDIKDFIRGENSLSVIRRLCFYIVNNTPDDKKVAWYKEHFPLSLGSSYVPSLKRRANDFLRQVCPWYSLRGSSQYFSKERFYKVYKVNSDRSFYNDGGSFNANVSSSFGVSKKGSGSFGLSLPTPAIVASSSMAKSWSEGLSLHTGVYLSVQYSSLDFDIQEYQKCASFRIIGLKGFVFCLDKQNVPKTVREYYSYIGQHFTPGDQLDMYALYNNPWLITVRGKKQLFKFLSHLRLDNPFFASSKGSASISDLARFIKLGDVAVDSPLDIIDRLNVIYHGTLPPFPTHYSLD